MKKLKLPCGRELPAVSGSGSGRSAAETEWKERLSIYLQERQLKQSAARNQIIEIVLGEPGHFSISDLVQKVQRSHPNIGAATVYRSIPVLVDCGLIKETLTDESGQMIYEVADSDGDHHDHIVCLDCDRIFEFHDETIESAQDKVSRKLSFKPTKHRHVIYAHCGFKK